MHARSPRLAALLALGLAFVTALVFVRGSGGGFLYDDYYLIEANPTLRAPGGMAHFLSTPLFAGTPHSGAPHWAAGSTQYWRPFLKLAFLLQFRAFGMDPLGYHLVSLALHVACVLLAFGWLLRRLAGAGTPGDLGAAALAAAVFALHPTRPEAVGWISGSADVWMTFWVLVGLTAWDRTSRAALGVAASAFALGVLCKETALVVPLCLGLDAWLLLPASRAERRTPLVRVGVVFAALVVVGIARLVLLPSPASALRAGLAPWRALSSLGCYVARVVWPLHPSTQIGLMSAAGRFELPGWSVGLGLATLVGIAGLGLSAWRRPAARPWLADLGWFVLPLTPVLNLVPLGYTTLVAERFLYWPLLGLTALMARGLAVGLRRPGKGPRALVTAAAAGCAWCGAISFAYLPALHSDETLWAHEIRLAPHNPLLYSYQAGALWAAGHLDTALDAARTSYELAELPDAKAEAAETWAMIRFQKTPGRETDALRRLRDFFDALAGEGAGPEAPARLDVEGLRFEVRPTAQFRVDLLRSVPFRSIRGVAHARTGDYAGAERQFRDLLRDDRSPATLSNLARCVAAQERWNEALAILADAARGNADDPNVAALVAPIQRGQALGDGAGLDPLQRVVQRANVWIDLGATPLARRELATLSPAQRNDPAVVVVSAFADASDGDPDAARRALQAARARDAAHASTYDAGLAALQRHPPVPPTPAARAHVDALFH